MPPSKPTKEPDASQQTDESRRLKKRELDRRCQRMARDRTKAHIAHLEKLVEEFRSQDSTGRISSLMEQLDAVKKERDELAKTLTNIAKLTQPHRADEVVKSEEAAEEAKPAEIQTTQTNTIRKKSVEEQVSPYRYPASPSTSPDDTTHETSYIAAAIRPRGTTAVTPAVSQPHDAFGDLDFGTTSTPAMWSGSIPNPSFEVSQNDLPFWEPVESMAAEHSHSAVCECSLPIPRWTRQNKPANLWRFANDVLIETTTPASRAQIVRIGQALDEEIPIRAVLEGWDAIDDVAGHNPNWQALRQIDEQLFAKCSNVERLAILYVMNGLLRAHAETGDERLNQLPAWYKTKPATPTLAKPYAVNYFAWPGLRQRFEEAPHRYCANDFWEIFSNSFRIQWPFEFRDCYSVNKQTKSYQLDPGFITRLRDLRSWTMDMEFFKRFPELYCDVPAGDSLPDQIWQPPPRAVTAHRRALAIEEQEKRRAAVAVTTAPPPQQLDASTLYMNVVDNSGVDGFGNIYMNNTGFDFTTDTIPGGYHLY